MLQASIGRKRDAESQRKMNVALRRRWGKLPT
jgi:hypothetical protein